MNHTNHRKIKVKDIKNKNVWKYKNTQIYIYIYINIYINYKVIFNRNVTKETNKQNKKKYLKITGILKCV